MPGQHGGRWRDRRRRGTLVAMGVLVGGGAAFWGWHVLETGGRPNVQAAAASHRGGHVRLTTTTSTTLPLATTTTDPGLLPQTTAFPSTQTPQFEIEMRDLFRAVVTDSVATAQPAYFPESAYLQLKTIHNARSDYVNRLEVTSPLILGRPTPCWAVTRAPPSCSRPPRHRGSATGSRPEFATTAWATTSCPMRAWSTKRTVRFDPLASRR